MVYKKISLFFEWLGFNVLESERITAIKPNKIASQIKANIRRNVMPLSITSSYS